MEASDLVWVNNEIMNRTVLAMSSNQRGGNSLIKWYRACNTDAGGIPTSRAVGLPARPVLSRWFAPAGPYGPDGNFADLYQFDWRIFVARIPPHLQDYLFPASSSAVINL